MGFKKVADYNKDKFGGLFRLQNDQDYADVIFLYQSADDVLIGDVHYIKSGDYSGYVHCAGRGCPACSKGIRTQTKLFVPLYNLSANEIQFFDRSNKFEPQLFTDVLSKFPNPSEYVFRITRHGVAGSVDTTYSIIAIAANTVMPYPDILAANGAQFPDYYEHICKEVDIATMSSWLNAASSATPSYASNTLGSYTPTPRATGAAPINPPPSTTDFDSMDDVNTLADDESLSPDDAPDF